MSARANAEAAAHLVLALSPHCREWVVSPGSRSTPLILALAHHEESEDLRLHLVLDERSAGFYALGLARRSRRSVGLICTSGSAAAHYLPALVEAEAAGIPLLVVTADRPPDQLRCGAAQTTDQHQLLSSHCREVILAPLPREDQSPLIYGHLALRAWAASTQPRSPGPAHINMPFAEPLWSEEEAAHSPSARARIELPREQRPSSEQVQALAAKLDRSARGVIVAGHLDRYWWGDEGSLGRAAAALAERLQWPLLIEPSSGCQTDSPQLIPHASLLMSSARLQAELRPDLVLRLGRTPCSKPLAAWLSRSPSVLIEERGLYLDPQHQAETLWSCSPALLMSAVAERVRPRRAQAWIDSWRSLERQLSRALSPLLEGGSLWEGAIAHRLAQALPPDCEVFVASGMPVRDWEQFGGRPARLCPTSANRGVNGIDGLLSSSLGMSKCHHGVQVVLIGDLAFLHDLGALSLLAEHRRPLVVLLVDNGGGGIFHFLPIVKHSAFERFFYTPPTLDPVPLWRAAGMTAEDVLELEELPLALEAARQRQGCTLLRVKVDPQWNFEQHQKAKALADGLQLPRQEA